MMVDYAVSKWRDLAIALGFKSGKIDIFEQDCKRKPVEECLSDMLEEWKLQTKKATWSDKLIVAVEKIGEINYAGDLKS